MSLRRLNARIANSTSTSNASLNLNSSTPLQSRLISSNASRNNRWSSNPTDDGKSKYSSPSYQSQIASQVFNAHSLSYPSRSNLKDDSSSSSNKPSFQRRRPFNGNDELAGFKSDSTSSNSDYSHFSYSGQHGKRAKSKLELSFFNQEQRQREVERFGSYGSKGAKSKDKGKGKGKENSIQQKQFDSEKRMLRLLQTDADSSVMNGMGKDEVKPGDFIELRKYGEAQQGILLSTPSEMADTLSHHLLLSTGDIITFYSTSEILLRFPNYAPKSLVDLASPSAEELEKASLPDNEITGAYVLDEKQLEARARLCTFIREMKSCSEQIMTEMQSNLRTLVEDSSSPLVSMLSISTRHASEILLPRTISSSPKSLPALLTAHMLLISNPYRFAVDTSAHRISSLFTIKSEKEVEADQRVIGWIRDLDYSDNGGPGGGERRGKKILQDFKIKSEKIKSWISETRESLRSPIKNLSEYVSNPPSPRITSPQPSISPSLKFTSEELDIISFFKTFLGNRRFIQKFDGASEMGVLLKYLCDSPLTSSTQFTPSSDLKSKDPDLYWDSLNHPAKYGFSENTLLAIATQFLQDIGVFKPWEKVSDMDNSFRSILEVKEPSFKRGKDGSLEIVDGLEEKREDFGDLPVYVIDDESAFELDDGVSISKVQSLYESSEVSSSSSDHFGKYWVHVHVADPTSIISPSSEVAEFARKRHSAIYLAEKRWPLLPESVVNGIGGVGLAATSQERSGLGGDEKGQRTLTFSALIDLKSNGSSNNFEVEEVKVQAGWIRNVKKLSYKEVGEILSSTDKSLTSTSITEKEIEELRALHNITELLSNQRSESSFGASRQMVAKFSLSLNDSSSLDSINPPNSQFSKLHPTVPSLPNCYTGFPSFSISIPGERESSETFKEFKSTSLAQMMVAELMVLAGRIGGTFATSKSISMPFRGQESPPESQLKKLKDLFTKFGHDYSEPEWVKADLEIKTGGHRTEAWEHFTMGISSSKSNLLNNGYIRSTSPLRRYPDLISHWQIKSQLLSNSNKKPIFTKMDLNPMLTEFDRLDSKIKSFQRNSDRSWFIIHLSRLLALDSNNPILGPHKAIVVLKGNRISKDLTARVRVRVFGLGIPAECEWGLREDPPNVGDEFEVRVKETSRSGGIMSLIVCRV